MSKEPQTPTVKPPELIIPPPKTPEKKLTCHRFYAPVVIPEVDKLNPRQMNVLPRLANFDCVKERCTLWNIEAGECRDVTNSKSWETIAQYAFGKANDALVQGFQ